jgi:hypothetical protein
VLQQKELIEQLSVDVEHFVATVVTENMVELRQPVAQIVAIFPITGAYPLAGIEVEETQFRPEVLRLASAGNDSRLVPIRQPAPSSRRRRLISCPSIRCPSISW